jgi:hypothetical protein
MNGRRQAAPPATGRGGGPRASAVPVPEPPVAAAAPALGSLTPSAVIALQRTAGNAAVGRLIQRLKSDEKADKLRVLTDWVRFTPPQTFADQFGTLPATKDAYRRRLLAKIRGNSYVQQSLKASKAMQRDDEDDSWEDGSFNDRTLTAAVDACYGQTIAARIGKVFDPFDKHDCVFAAITHVLGFGDKLNVSVAIEKRVADWFGHNYGEVEDSILYRMMEILGWGFLGRFHDWAEMFGETMIPATYIASQDLDTAGTSGHVFAVEPDGDATSFTPGATLRFRVYDRQAKRGYKQPAEPKFSIYVWRVNPSSAKAAELATLLRGG